MCILNDACKKYISISIYVPWLLCVRLYCDIKVILSDKGKRQRQKAKVITLVFRPKSMKTTYALIDRNIKYFIFSFKNVSVVSTVVSTFMK